MASAAGSNPAYLNFTALLQQADRVSDATLAQLIKRRLHELQPIHDAISKDFEHPTPDLPQRIQAVIQRGLFRPPAELATDKKRVFSQIFDPIDRRYQVLLGLVPPPPVLAAPSPYIDFDALQRLPGADKALPRQLLDIVFRENDSIVQAFQGGCQAEVRDKIATLFHDHIDPLCSSAAAAAAGPDALDPFLKPIRAAYDAMQRSPPASVHGFTSVLPAVLAPVRYELPFKRLKSEAKQFTNETIRKHALTSIKAIKAEHLQIEKEAAGAIADARRINLVERIDGIAQRCLDFSELPRHATNSIARLKICLEEALQPLESIKRRLTVDERKQETEQQQFVFERASKKSQLLRNEQEEYYRCSLFGEFLHEIGQEYGGENRNPTIFLAYANPTATQHEHESWIPKFVARLQKLLVKSKFTHVENMHVIAPGEDRKAHIAKAETSDVVILFGSRSLCEGEDSNTSALMTHIEDNRTCRKFPILLHDALPAEFSGTSIDWREKGFVKQFLKLFVALWGCPKDCTTDLLTRWDQKAAPMLNPGWYADQRKAIDACPDRAALEKIPISRQVNTASPVTAAAGVTEKPLDERLIDRLREHFSVDIVVKVPTFSSTGEWEKSCSIDQFYCRLAMITEEERKQDKKRETLDGRLPTYETILKEKKEIEPGEIFSAKKIKRAVIYGAAGVGKTTFSSMLLYRWAKKELFSEFKAVFVIRLRNLSEKMYAKEAVTPYDILKREHPALGLDFKEVFDDLEFRNNSLLLLDGWDELPAAAKDGGHLYEPFQALQDLFPHILVTSRPGHVGITPECEFEILGFSASQIERYVGQYFNEMGSPDKVAPLIRWIKQSHLAYSAAHIPIQLSMLCGLYQAGDPIFVEGTTFSTSTLYERMLNQFLKMYMRRIGEPQDNWQHRTTLSSKPSLQPLLGCLEEIAMGAMEEGSLYVKGETIERIGDTRSVEPIALRNLGLFSVEHGRGSFIHLTFQEFFAARFITRLYGSEGTRRDALGYVQKHKFDTHFQLVFPMVAGLLSQDAKALQAFFDDLHAEPRDLAKTFELTLLARCFEECEDPAKISQHEGFIEEVVRFLRAHVGHGRTRPLLRGNRKLMDREEVQELFLLMRRISVDVAGVLVDYTSVTHSLPEKLIDNVKGWKDSRKAYILGNCWREEEVVHILREDDRWLGPNAAAALGKMAAEGIKLREDSMAALGESLKDRSRDENTRCSVVVALGNAASQGIELEEGVIDWIARFARDSEKFYGKDVAEALAKIASAGGERSENAFKALVDLLRTRNSRYHGLSPRAANALGKIVLQIRTRNSRYHDLSQRAANALGEIALQRGELADRALKELVKCLSDRRVGALAKYFGGAQTTHIYVAEVLRGLLAKGIQLDKATLGALGKHPPEPPRVRGFRESFLQFIPEEPADIAKLIRSDMVDSKLFRSIRPRSRPARLNVLETLTSTQLSGVYAFDPELIRRACSASNRALYVVDGTPAISSPLK